MTIWKPAIGVLLVACAVRAEADDALYSGPQPGEQLQSLHVIPAYRADQDPVDFVEDSDGKPTLLVFVHGANRPAARLTRVLMNYAEMKTGDGLYAAAIWLDDDPSQADQYLNQAISWWGVGPPVGISVAGAEGPGSYGLNRNVNVTVIVASENRVTANHALVQPGETDAPGILTDVLALIDGDVPNAAQVIFLSLPTRKPSDAPWNTAPRNVELRELIFDLLGATDGADIDLAAREIEEFVFEQPELQGQLTRVAELLTKGRTNVGSIPAASVLHVWRERSNPAGLR